MELIATLCHQQTLSFTLTTKDESPTLLQRVFVGLCLLMLLDGAWVGLQTYAWMKMVWDRSDEMGWSQAVKDVANGQTPCEICIFIEAERDLEGEKAPQQQVESNLRQPMALAQTLEIVPSVLLGEVKFIVPVIGPSERSECPPVPPPRWLS